MDETYEPFLRQLEEAAKKANLAWEHGRLVKVNSKSAALLRKRGLKVDNEITKEDYARFKEELRDITMSEYPRFIDPWLSKPTSELTPKRILKDSDRLEKRGEEHRRKKAAAEK